MKEILINLFFASATILMLVLSLALTGIVNGGCECCCQVY